MASSTALRSSLTPRLPTALFSVLCLIALSSGSATAEGEWPPAKVTPSHRLLVQAMQEGEAAGTEGEEPTPSVAGIDRRVAALPGFR